MIFGTRMSRTVAKVRHARTMAVMSAAVALALTGCAADRCPPTQQSAPNSQQEAPAKPKYGFGVPKGDPSLDRSTVNTVYSLLGNRKCKTAADNMDDDAWQDFLDPREVLLVQAAVELCGNNDKKADPRRAAALYEAVSDQFGGWNHIGWSETSSSLSWHVCEMYKSVASTIDKKDRDDVICSNADAPDKVLQWQADTDPRALVQR
ncbi:hypothetical protein [Catellatospora bangladeshensis]|uniref:Lipoprotein n=2 Tax=Catellatospora bangladeshensis TaxID=310355 RepID=A0A8J3JQ28_9ACTN|nr:hypothetical protein [Catellatospora bangladeshensis]GIF84638.1 hypothetical protein Cba03nite_59870 [Catellatospora bangladeshensis]